ncbi:MAG TPA: hypothetical protein VJA19_19135 [Pseudomonas sp.]|nr:hypothetical protein [Pseudomonas sp.]
MHSGPLPLVFALSALLSLPLSLHAEESLAQPLASTAETQLDALEQRLAESEQARAELATQLQAQASGDGERENAQLLRLRQDNQRLKLQLREAQAGQPPRLFSEQQLWFALGGAVTLTATLLGALLRGKRRSRGEWSN